MSDRPGAIAPVDNHQMTEEQSAVATGASFLTEIRAGGPMGDGTGGSDASYAPTSRLKLSAPTALVLVVAAVGIGALLGMRKLTGPGTTVAAVKIEYTPGDRTAREAHKRIVEVLDRSSTPVQVPTDQIKKNPFQLVAVTDGGTPKIDDSEQKNAERLAAQVAERERKKMTMLATLKVNSVLTGTVPVARVNNDVVRVGDAIGDGLFTVSAINGRGVTVEADGHEYELVMEEGAANPKAPRKR